MTRVVDPVALVMCPTWGINMPPLGVGYLTAYLRSQGWLVRALDLNVEIYHRAPAELKRYWREEYIDLWMQENFMELIGQQLLPLIDWSVERILSTRPRTVGFSVNQANLFFSFQVAERLRQRIPDLIIIFGGPGVYWVDRNRSFPIGILNWKGEPALPLDTIDLFVHGDGEETLAEVLRALAAGEDLASINAITYRANGGFKTTGPHRPNRNFDHYPFPDFDWVDFNAYREIELELEIPARIAPIILSRGCTNNCKFCNDFVMQGKFRTRSAERTVQEMRYRLEIQGLLRFFFCDLLVNGDMEQLLAMAQGLIRERLPELYPQISWTGQALAHRRMTRPYLDTMYRSGCRALSYGVESLSDTVLLAMRKNITVVEIVDVLKASKAAGIYNQINLIVGYPGEGEEEFQETVDNLKRLRPWIDRVSALSMLTMTYGSPLFSTYYRSGGFREVPDWHRRWIDTQDSTNTFEVRSERFERLHRVLEELGLMTLLPQHYEKAREGARVELNQSMKPC